MTTAAQTRRDAAQMIADVMADGSRIDRNLRRADDGTYYTTPDRDFLTGSGSVTPAYVNIPADNGGGADDELLEWGFGLLDELDELLD